MNYLTRHEIEAKLMQAPVPPNEQARKGAFRKLKHDLLPSVSPADKAWFSEKIAGRFGF